MVHFWLKTNILYVFITIIPSHQKNLIMSYKFHKVLNECVCFIFTKKWVIHYRKNGIKNTSG